MIWAGWLLMISVIISSADKEQLQAVTYNIEKTIGVPYELLVFSNGDGAQSICEVYNKGAWQAKYEILCFMHEDIEIKTGNWGKAVIDTFREHPLLGLIGVVGCRYKSLAPSGWALEAGIDYRIYYANIIQQYKYNNRPSHFFYRNYDNKRLARVACIDGVWFCTKKSHVIEFPFDQQLLKGFHGYDIDFSLKINQKYDVAVTFDVLIEHFSEGRFDETWMKNILKVHEKWSHFLPLDRQGVSKKEIFFNEKRAFRYFLDQLAQNHFSAWTMLKTLWSTRVHKRVSFLLLLKLHVDILRHFIKQMRAPGKVPEHNIYKKKADVTA